MCMRAGRNGEGEAASALVSTRRAGVCKEGRDEHAVACITFASEVAVATMVWQAWE